MFESYKASSIKTRRIRSEKPLWLVSKDGRLRRKAKDRSDKNFGKTIWFKKKRGDKKKDSCQAGKETSRSIAERSTEHQKSYEGAKE